MFSSGIFPLTLVLCILVTLPVMAQNQAGRGDRIVGHQFATRSPVLAQNGIAATSQPLASQVAIDILKKGGSAVDAAIAANAALGLMEPTGCGIGGDLFAIVWDPETRELHGLNASGRSPLGLSYDDMSSRLDEMGASSIPMRGSLSVSVPGAVDGWFELHGKFGRLPMTEILAPAIDYARNGFPVSQVIADAWSSGAEALLNAGPALEEVENFKKAQLIDGRSPKEGEVFQNPDLGNTYEMIAREGRDAFYKGTLADVMDAYMQRISGPLRKADLEAHTSEWIEPVSVNYRGYDVYELPPNGQGIAALQMLNVLEAYDLEAMGHNSAEYLHVHLEAKKLAFNDRARFYADPAFTDIPIKGLLSKEYAAQQREQIKAGAVIQAVNPGDPRLINGDTIYLTVADKDGMMVSFIQSNFLGLGSGLVPDGLGFMFQDRGALFTMEEGHPNVYEPGKRPFHTIIPAFVMKDGEPFLSFGVMGGDMQPQGHVQILANIIDFGMNVQEAGDAARYRHTGSAQPTGGVMTTGGQVHLEGGVDEAVWKQLEAWGHTVVSMPGGYGGYQAILWDPVNKVYHGATEMRKDGEVVGY